MTWAWIGAYCVSWLIVARLLAGHLAWRMFENGKMAYPSLYRSHHRPMLDQWTGAWAVALVLGAIWPAVLLVYRVPWRIGAEREALLKQRAERIEELERETGYRR